MGLLCPLAVAAKTAQNTCPAKTLSLESGCTHTQTTSNYRTLLAGAKKSKGGLKKVAVLFQELNQVRAAPRTRLAGKDWKSGWTMEKSK